MTRWKTASPTDVQSAGEAKSPIERVLLLGERHHGYLPS